LLRRAEKQLTLVGDTVLAKKARRLLLEAERVASVRERDPLRN
jgi:hypothetical protein